MRLATATPDRLVVALTLDACPGDFDERIATALVESGIPRRSSSPISGCFAIQPVWRSCWRIAICSASRTTANCIFRRSSATVVSTAFRSPAILSPCGVRSLQGAAAINIATGAAPRWYRAATGYYSPSAIPAIQQLGFGIAGYSLNADAGASLPARSVAARIANATNGEVIVAHINQPYRPSGEGVVAGVRELQRRGASFRRLDQLAAADIAYD